MWLLAGLIIVVAWPLPSTPAAEDNQEGNHSAQHAAEAVTPEQVESDWLHADQLRARAPSTGSAVLPEDDAAGGCDGVKDGNWGFHTANEANPWWQVDLGSSVDLGRLMLFNRCDGFAERNRHLCVLLSDDGRAWRQVYQHNGSVFYGHSDGKPLEVDLRGHAARYVRLQLPGTSYFHLDEVEVYPAGSEENVALGKPATQSSTSRWSAWHAQPSTGTKEYRTEQAIQRGRQLAECLRRLGANADEQSAALDDAEKRLATLGHDAPEDARRQLYHQVRWAVRRMALSNPLLDFDTVLFVKRAPPAFPHMSDQYYGWWARPGGGIYLLEGITSGQPRLRCLTEGWPPGSFLRPDIACDGRRLLFAYARYYPHVFDIRDKVNKDNLPEDSFYHVFEMDLATGQTRQLTRGKYNDFDARYLPCGDIVFLSTRKGQSIQVTCRATQATLQADLAESYVRCGGDNWRPVPVFTLHRMSADGSLIRAISAFENFEWTPSVAHDGRILYARWDYIDRFNGPFMSLWSTNPDGTKAQLVYGNYTVRPQCVFEARAIPGSHRLVFTAAAHHSNMGGSLALLDRSRGTEFERPIERLTPEVCFPETEGWPEHYFASPYPLSEDFYLVAWSDRRLPPHTFCTDQRNPVNPTGIYLLDRFGNLELLHRDPQIASMEPLPVRPRPCPPVIPDLVEWNGQQEGAVLVQDVYRGLEGIQRGTVKQLRIVAVPPKVQPHMNNPVLGVSREDPGKFILGTVPVEADGSALFRIPSGIPVFFQALDHEGLAVQTMRSLAYVQPGQTLTCVGCHEHRDTAPPVQAPPMAATRQPSKLRLGPPGTWPLRYDELVQPVLDKHCTGCHSAQGKDPKAAEFDLTADRSYDALLTFADEDLKKLAFEQDRSLVANCPAHKSKLLALLRGGQGHYGVQLDGDALERLVTWMDTYAHRQGHFSADQEDQLRQLRRQWAHLLASEATAQ